MRNLRETHRIVKLGETRYTLYFNSKKKKKKEFYLILFRKINYESKLYTKPIFKSSLAQCFFCFCCCICCWKVPEMKMVSLWNLNSMNNNNSTAGGEMKYVILNWKKPQQWWQIHWKKSLNLMEWKKSKKQTRERQHTYWQYGSVLL